MFGDNQLSTVLLLIALGLLIYLLTKPTAISEWFTSPETKPEAKAETKPVLSYGIDSNTVDSILNEANPEQPKTEPVNIDSSVFQFNPNDMQESGDATGALLDDAFKTPMPQELSLSSVDLKKKNNENYDAKNFLPKEINDKWFDTDFSQAKVNINDDKLINPDHYVIGINTVGQSLKNASYDIRGTVPNPKFSVSPWNNSTYEPDYNLKPLC
jgi:hypothetical protein